MIGEKLSFPGFHVMRALLARQDLKLTSYGGSGGAVHKTKHIIQAAICWQITYAVCEQQAGCISAQSEQSLCCLLTPNITPAKLAHLLNLQIDLQWSAC